MKCPKCRCAKTGQCAERTHLGYVRRRCQSCGHRFNERSGTVFNHLQYPTDIVLLVVLWRTHYKLSLRDRVSSERCGNGKLVKNNTSIEINSKLVEDLSPIEDGHGPLLGDVAVCQKQQLADGVGRRKYGFVLSRLAQLAVVTFKSGNRGALLRPSPLRTARMSFPISSSSFLLTTK
jgi:hypothetical protein